MNVTVFDYGAGNLHSLVKALEHGGADVRVDTSPSRAVQDTDALILPGVGAFTPAAECLLPGRDAMRAAIARGLPCLGICLGMQLLFERSEEGPGLGLGIIPGDVSRLHTRRVPQIGWNAVVPVTSRDPLFVRSQLEVAYYANSYVCRPDAGSLDVVVAWSEHDGDRFPAVVRSGRVVGAQFHPEKSSRNGLRFLEAFLDDVNHTPGKGDRGVPMIAIPAVDLRDGKCVQLVGGEFSQEKVRLDDPVAVARDWMRQGFRRLHVVDLDAATKRGNNTAIVREILRNATVPVQVGGGVRDEARIEQLLEDGATYVVVGTRAVEEPDWLAEMAELFPSRLIVAADVRERRIVSQGWSRTMSRDVLDFVEELVDWPLAGVLVTAVHKEGQLQGTDLPLMEDVAEASAHEVIASGGVSSLDDMRALEHRGVGAAVLGMALYTGAIEVRPLLEEFAS